MERKRECITTTQLFLSDSHLVEFTSRVERQWNEAGQNLLTLSETAFYPTSGGQPHDTGTINGAKVLDVYEENGKVVHVVENKVESSAEVLGIVDWTRRHDHMQQHTGQHILSQAIIQICDTPTVGFAIGPDWSTIVLNKKPEAEDLESALELANTIIDENRSVEVLFPSATELAQLPIRGALPEKENIRVIRVDGFDWSPCGGTHTKSTADVRLIVVLGIRKEKDSYRLEFVCGRRAERIALQYARDISDVAVQLDVGPTEVADRTRALLKRSRSQEEMIAELREARLQLDRERLIALLGEGDGVCATILNGRSVQELRQLAHGIVEQPNRVALLVGLEENKLGLAFARSEDREEDMSQLMRSVCEETGCRGGGNPAFATGGGGAEVDAAIVLEAAKLALARI